VKAIGSFHGGRLATDEPDSPHLSVGRITGEVYFGHADQDHAMTAEQIKTLESALDEAGVSYRFGGLRGRVHGYTMTDTAAYHEEGERAALGEPVLAAGAGQRLRSSRSPERGREVARNRGFVSTKDTGPGFFVSGGDLRADADPPALRPPMWRSVR